MVVLRSLILLHLMVITHPISLAVLFKVAAQFHLSKHVETVAVVSERLGSEIYMPQDINMFTILFRPFLYMLGVIVMCSKDFCLWRDSTFTRPGVN